MYLLTALSVQNSPIFAEIYFIFLEKCPTPNLKGFQYLSEKIGKLVNN